MKKIIAVSLLPFIVGFCAGMSHALDFGDFLNKPRAGYAIDTKGAQYLGAYAPIKTYSPKGIDYASFNVGYVWKESDKTMQAPCAQVGLRLDNILMLPDKTAWGQANLKSSKLPTFEAGPMLVVIPIKNEAGKLIFVFKALFGVAIGF